jgi:N-acetyl-alpha-D-muramate 1-phosphate uridylyltransferase
MSLPVAVLAGGLATRLRPITEVVPKSLLEVAGQPFVFHQLELLRRNDLSDVVLLVGHLGEKIREAVGDGSRWRLRVRYAFDGPAQRGTGGALRQALPMLGGPFFVLYGDSYLECDYARIEDAFGRSRRLGLMTVCRNDDQWDRSNVLLANGEIVRYDKRDRTADMAHIDYGLGVLSPEALESWPASEAFDLALVYQDLLCRGQLAAFEVPARFYEIGSPAGLDETRRYLAGKGTLHA